MELAQLVYNIQSSAMQDLLNLVMWVFEKSNPNVLLLIKFL